MKKNSRNVGPVSSEGSATVVEGVVGVVPSVATTAPSVTGTGAGVTTGRKRGAGVVTLSGAWIACNIKQYRY